MDFMPRMSNPIDHTGKQVAANIKRLRGAMQYKELAEKLASIGHPLTPVAIRDAESGKRKVDVDDLMAFAMVFEVSPLTLLLPNSGSRDTTTQLTGYSHKIGCNIAWLWACGDEPIEVPHDPARKDGNRSTIAAYRQRAKPTVDEREGMAAGLDWSGPFSEETMKRFLGILQEKRGMYAAVQYIQSLPANEKRMFDASGSSEKYREQGITAPWPDDAPDNQKPLDEIDKEAMEDM